MPVISAVLDLDSRVDFRAGATQAHEWLGRSRGREHVLNHLNNSVKARMGAARDAVALPCCDPVSRAATSGAVRRRGDIRSGG